MNDDNHSHESLGPIEYVSEVTESTNDHQYNDAVDPYAPYVKEQTVLSVIGLVLAFPFPIFTILLWTTLNTIKGQGMAFSEHTMSAVFLYLIQFFIVPVLSISSVVIAFIVTIKSKAIAKKLGYVSMAVTGAGLIILGIFLNHS